MQQMAPLAQIVFYLLALALIAVPVANAIFWLRDSRSIGGHLHHWARKYPLYPTCAIALLGALLGHFFWP